MKYQQPLIVHRLLAVYHANEKILKESSALHAALHHAFSPGRKKAAMLQELRHVQKEIQKLKFAVEFLHTDLKFLAHSRKKYFTAPGITAEDVAFSQAFLNTAASNCSKTLRVLPGI